MAPRLHALALPAAVVLLWLACCASRAALVEYTFVVRRVPYSADGYPRPVIGVFELGAERLDAPFPGPLIRATLGDSLRVTVVNEFEQETTSLHFHGLEMLANPWADGVQGITECGIRPGENKTYAFTVTQTGTFWYHSHTSVQYGEGLQGPIILDYPTSTVDPIRSAFNYSSDTVLMLADWYHDTSQDLLTRALGPWGSYGGFVPDYPWPPPNILINGHGRTDCNVTACFPPAKPGCLYQQCIAARQPLLGSCNASFPLHVDTFSCSNGSHARIRLINTATGVPLRVWIDRHRLTLVARDGVPIVPMTVRFLTINIGQRYDAMVPCSAAMSSPLLNYRLYVTFASGLIPSGAGFPAAYYTALLTYPGAAPNAIAAPDLPMPQSIHNESLFNDSQTFEFTLPPLAAASSRRGPHGGSGSNADHADDGVIHSSSASDDGVVGAASRRQRRAVRHVSAGAARRVFVTYRVVLDQLPGSPIERWTVNNVTFAPPRAPVLQTLASGATFASVRTWAPGQSGASAIGTYTEHIAFGETVEIVMLGLSSQQHPWHMHGYTLDFVAVGALPSTAIVPDESSPCNGLTYNVTHLEDSVSALLPDWSAPLPVLARADTFTVPANGYVVFRLRADNAGPWLFHCHNEWHLAMGQAMLLSVENAQGTYAGLIADPPSDLTVCGSLASWRAAIALPQATSATLQTFSVATWVLLAAVVALSIATIVLCSCMFCGSRSSSSSSSVTTSFLRA